MQLGAIEIEAVAMQAVRDNLLERGNETCNGCWEEQEEEEATDLREEGKRLLTACWSKDGRDEEREGGRG